MRKQELDYTDLHPVHNIKEIDFKYGFEFIVGEQNVESWNFDILIADIISWIAINIGDRDDTRWNIDIRLKYTMNPIAAKYRSLRVYFVEEIDAAAFKLRWL